MKLKNSSDPFDGIFYLEMLLQIIKVIKEMQNFKVKPLYKIILCT